MTIQGNASFVIRQEYTAMGQLQTAAILCHWERTSSHAFPCMEHPQGSVSKFEADATAGTRLGHRGFVNNTTTGSNSYGSYRSSYRTSHP
jgi:hypothetical protein